jgi:hypothetical protein
MSNEGLILYHLFHTQFLRTRSSKSNMFQMDNWNLPATLGVIRKNSVWSVLYDEDQQQITFHAPDARPGMPYTAHIEAHDSSSIPWSTAQWLYLLRKLSKYAIHDNAVSALTFWPHTRIPWPIQPYPPPGSHDPVRVIWKPADQRLSIHWGDCVSVVSLGIRILPLAVARGGGGPV